MDRWMNNIEYKIINAEFISNIIAVYISITSFASVYIKAFRPII